MNKQLVSDNYNPKIIRKNSIPALMRTPAPYNYGSHRYDEIDAQTCVSNVGVSQI